LKQGLQDSNALIRYGAVIDFLHRESKLTKEFALELTLLLDDPEGLVRIAAAEALAVHGGGALRARGLEVLLQQATARTGNFYAALHAANALDHARPLPPLVIRGLSEFAKAPQAVPDFAKNYRPRLLDALLDR
jgi:hypothetical protein